jgi:2-polyprenyl-6-hydroxyphenyl methylase/3-demethylubiquinone-9 3-methyltransferase
MNHVEHKSTTSDRFAFGANWRRYLSSISEQRIASAQESLLQLLHAETLQSQRFLDAGTGSGLFSLAANRLGASVTSFDVDAECVACAEELRRRFAREPTNWTIRSGSLLDREFLNSLGNFDVVYCWGVAHHTGQMWDAIENLQQSVAPGGLFVLAIYNDQLYVSRAWRGIKQLYQRLPRLARPILVAGVGLSLAVKRLSMTLLASLVRLVTLRNPATPFVTWFRTSQARGMHGWYDLVDWVGGWPYEVARPEDVFRFLLGRGFELRELRTSTGHGCNEFVFQKRL